MLLRLLRAGPPGNLCGCVQDARHGGGKEAEGKSSPSDDDESLHGSGLEGSGGQRHRRSSGTGAGDSGGAGGTRGGGAG